MVPLVCGCSLMNGSGDRQKPDWDTLAPKIQSRVRYVAAFAFTMDQVRPHKEQICETAERISNMLDEYDDRDASFEKVRAAVMKLISEIPDPGLREAATVFADMVLTEAFNYAWEHYEDMINQDAVQTAVLVARAIGNGLREACEMTVGSMGLRSSYAKEVFTVPSD